MKLYVDGEKKNATASGESAKKTSTIGPDSVKYSGTKPIKIYVDSGDKKIPDTEADCGMPDEGRDPYGKDGFRPVVPDFVHKEDHRESDPWPKKKKEVEIPVIPHEDSNDKTGNKKAIGSQKIIVALLAAACAFLILYVLSSPRLPEVIVETMPPDVPVIETVAPAKAFSDDPIAISTAAESVVIVYATDGEYIWQGSGFACFANNVFVTNRHVVEGSGRIEASTENGETFAIQSWFVSAEADIAILITETPHNLPLLQLGNSKNLLKGEKVVAIGSPDGLMNSVSDGVFSRYDADGTLQMTATIWHGSSGGALFNDEGAVIGVTSGGLEGLGINFAVPIEYAEKLYQGLY